ncbi:MAG: hypothetical protein Q8M95_10165 [Candidatus Methanoperedens sp.]|nr:hypothetical protein [Candidatus Methanoperedenaceae archaeon]MDP3104955.1 hypothetical protein [Candidatus Methanoperedens sp.]
MNMELRPIDEMMLTTKYDGKYLIDWFNDEKIGATLTFSIADLPDDTVTCLNQLFIILKLNLWAEINSDKKIVIELISKKYAIRRASNTKLDSAIPYDYKAFLIAAYQNRFQKPEHIQVNSKTERAETKGTGIANETNEMTEKKKKELRKGLADMKGTRSAASD